MINVGWFLFITISKMNAHNKIENFQNHQYLSSCYCYWRTAEFDMVQIKRPVITLPIHLENEKMWFIKHTPQNQKKANNSILILLLLVIFISMKWHQNFRVNQIHKNWKKYQSHIYIEYCHTVTLVKYLFFIISKEKIWWPFQKFNLLMKLNIFRLTNIWVHATVIGEQPNLIWIKLSLQLNITCSFWKL